MASDETWQLLYISKIGLGTVFGEERLDFVATLPVGLMSAQHTAIVARLIDENLGVELVLNQSLAHLSCHMCHFAIGGRTTFLLRTQPVPMAIRLIVRADIIDMNTIMLFDAFEGSGDKFAKLIIAVIFQVDGSATSCIGSQSILCIEHWSRVAECEDVRNASLFGKFQKLALSCLFAPIVSAIGIEKTLGACASLYLGSFTLFFATGTEIESPDRQADAFGLALTVILCTE